MPVTKTNAAPRLLLPWALAAIAVALLLACTWAGLLIGFDSDDLMNLQGHWSKPLPALLRALVFPFTTVNRPTGAAYYRLCYTLFGWQPLLFRTVTYVFMSANIGLVFLLARRLTRSNEAAFLAALLFSVHGRFYQIYTSNGTVYDVLCAFFSLAVLCLYAKRPFTLRHELAIGALFILAINAKEMAAALPLVLLAYEWIYGGRPGRQELRRWRTPCLCLVIAVLSVWAKTQPGGGLTNNPAYAQVFTLKRFFGNARLLYAELLYLPERSLYTHHVLLLWGLLFLIAFLSRRRALWFCAWFALLAPLPIMFIPYRGFFVMYFPFAAWALYLGTALAVARERLAPPRWTRASQAVLAALVIAVVLAGTRDEHLQAWQLDPLRPVIAGTEQDFLRLNEPLPRRGSILLLHSRYPADAWGPLMTAQLLYNDRELWLDRPAMMPHPPTPADYHSYDLVLDFDGRQFTVVQRGKSDAGRPPAHYPSATLK